MTDKLQLQDIPVKQTQLKQSWRPD